MVLGASPDNEKPNLISPINILPEYQLFNRKRGNIYIDMYVCMYVCKLYVLLTRYFNIFSMRDAFPGGGGRICGDFSISEKSAVSFMNPCSVCHYEFL